MASYTSALAYFITYHTYGTWLHGNEAGSVDSQHNIPGTPMLPSDPVQEARVRTLMKQSAYLLDAARRECVLRTIQEVCIYRHWPLLATHVRSTHVHVVVQSSAAPEKVMNDFKSYSSRRLAEAGFEEHNRKRWTEHGSTRYLWEPAEVEAAIQYVIHEQGEPMAWYENQERIITPHPNPPREQG